MWEFVLNNKFHKIEIFHSKITGKKKLCLDAQQLIEDQGYQSSFTYSFKIDKHYFNIVQESLDLYQLRIDNKLFENLMLDERSGRLKPPVPTTTSQPVAKETSFKPKPQDEPIPDYLRTVDSYKRNDDNFYDSDDNNFDFSGGKSNSNNFTFKKQEEKKAEIKKKPENQLLDFNDIADIQKAQQPLGQTVQQKQSANVEIFQHNQNLFNSINVFEEDKKQNDNNLMLENIFSANNSDSNKGNYNHSSNNQLGFLNNSPNANMMNQKNNANTMQFNPNPNIMTTNSNMLNNNIQSNESFANFGNNNLNQYNPNPISNLNMNVNMNIGYGEIQSTQQDKNSNLNVNGNNNFNQLNQHQIINQPYSIMNDHNSSMPPLQSSTIHYNANNISNKESSPFNIVQNSSNSSIINQYQLFPNQAQDVQPQSQFQEPKNDFKVNSIIILFK